MADEIRRAWDVVWHARMQVGRTLGKPLGGPESALRLEGIVHARGSFCPPEGPVVTEINCRDGAVWVIDYDEQSPYHAFAGRRVVTPGFPCEPPMQHVIGVRGHFAVSTMRLVEVTPDAWLTEVGAGYPLCGRFAHHCEESAALAFVTETGETFLVANNPAGATVGGTVQVLAYPVQLSPCISRSPQPFLWVICPWSYADLEELRGRPSAGLPGEVYAEAESGQVRRRRVSAEPGAAGGA
jgi:hypothetical protein